LPFNGRSCLMFLMEVRDDRYPEAVLRRLLYEHAQACDCDCSACIELRKRHELMELEAMH